MADGGAEEPRADPGAEEPRADPGAEEPRADPGAEEPRADPGAEEPRADPGAEEPRADPGAEEPRADPGAEEPRADPGAEEPRADPGAEEPRADPGAEEPRADPGAEEGPEGAQGAGGQASEAAGRQEGPPAGELPAAQGGDGGPGPSPRKSRAERLAARDAAAGTDRPIVVDATNHIAGRLASNVAKLLLKGNRVSIVNCERIMISGTRSNIVGEYKQFLEIASILHPKHGPFHPRRPDTIITRMIRGMLPRKKPSGRAAHRRLRAYIGAPKDLGAYKRVRFEKAMITRPAPGYTTMASLGDAVGWTR